MPEYTPGAGKKGKQEVEAYALGPLDAFALLAANPYIGRERTEVSPPVRLYSHRAHHILYVIESGDVLVLRILHGRQDWLHQLEGVFAPAPQSPYMSSCCPVRDGHLNPRGLIDLKGSCP